MPRNSVHANVIALLLPILVGGADSCCMSNKFSATVETSGSTELNRYPGGFSLDYDYDQKKMSMRYLAAGGGYTYHVTTIQDYMAHVQYLTFEGQPCRVESNDQLMLKACVPDAFTLEGTRVSGTGSTIQTWVGNNGTEKEIIETTDACVVISISRHTIMPDNTFKEMFRAHFYNVTQNKLSSANPFVIPDSCKHVQRMYKSWPNIWHITGGSSWTYLHAVKLYYGQRRDDRDLRHFFYKCRS